MFGRHGEAASEASWAARSVAEHDRLHPLNPHSIQYQPLNGELPSVHQANSSRSPDWHQSLRPQSVLILLPNFVRLENLNLSALAIEAKQKLHQSSPFTDVILTVASTPLVTSSPCVRTADVSDKTVQQGNGLVHHVATQTELADRPHLSFGPNAPREVNTMENEPETSAISTMDTYTQTTTHSDSKGKELGGGIPLPQEAEALTAEAVMAVDEQPVANPSKQMDSERGTMAHNQDSLIGTAWGFQPNARGPASHPTIVPYTPPSSTPIHPFPYSILTTDRPDGHGPTPYHVTIRGLRPSISANQLLALAASYPSLEKLFYPPYAMKRYVGRAAIYFFGDRRDAWAFGTMLRKQITQGQLRQEIGLTEQDVADARRRGVEGEGESEPGGESTPFAKRQVELSVANSDLTKVFLQQPVGNNDNNGRNKAVENVVSADSPQAGSVNATSTKEVPFHMYCAGNNNAWGDEDDSEAASLSDPSEWDPPVVEHFAELISGADIDHHAQSSSALRHSPSLVTTTTCGLNVDQACHHVILQNIRQNVASADLLFLAQKCTSLVNVYFPPLSPTRSIVGRTAFFFMSNEHESRAFYEYLKTLVRGKHCEHFKVTSQDLPEARKQGITGKKKDGQFAPWQVNIRVIYGGGCGAKESQADGVEDWKVITGKRARKHSMHSAGNS